MLHIVVYTWHVYRRDNAKTDYGFRRSVYTGGCSAINPPMITPLLAFWYSCFLVVARRAILKIYNA